jgi:hypothetical protein
MMYAGGGGDWLEKAASETVTLAHAKMFDHKTAWTELRPENAASCVLKTAVSLGIHHSKKEKGDRGGRRESGSRRESRSSRRGRRINDH